jgi:hypothetical protein
MIIAIAMATLPDQRICVGTDARFNFHFDSLTVSEKFQLSVLLKACLMILPELSLLGMIIFVDWFAGSRFCKYDCAKNKLLPIDLKNKWHFGQVNCLFAHESINFGLLLNENGILVVDEKRKYNRLNLERNRI